MEKDFIYMLKHEEATVLLSAVVLAFFLYGFSFPAENLTGTESVTGKPASKANAR